MAHLDSGHTPDCCYNESQIFLDSFKKINGTRHYEFYIQNDKFVNDNCYGICRDFEILTETKEKVFRGIGKSLNLSL
ncbi:MAG: hypothetical protein OQK82_08185 [Candidatus Pacearchaeota archaeon]|nr:hypothetical protein [Candidatus Pacearchaeota archaeon]